MPREPQASQGERSIDEEAGRPESGVGGGLGVEAPAINVAAHPVEEKDARKRPPAVRGHHRGGRPAAPGALVAQVSLHFPFPAPDFHRGDFGRCARIVLEQREALVRMDRGKGVPQSAGLAQGDRNRHPGRRNAGCDEQQNERSERCAPWRRPAFVSRPPHASCRSTERSGTQCSIPPAPWRWKG